MWGRKEGMTLKLCPLIVYYMKNIFMEKSCRKYAPKASPRPLSNFGKQPKIATASKKFLPLHARNCLLFRTQSLLMDKIIINKRSLELVTSRSSGYEKSLEKFLY